MIGINLFKKNKIKFFSEIFSKQEVSQHVLKFPNNIPSYFKSIPQSLFDLTKNKFLRNHSTIKTCAGFHNIFRRSLLLTCPFDIQLIFEKNGELNFSSCGKDTVNSAEFISSHPNWQFLDYVKTDYIRVIKIGTKIACTSTVPYLIHQSWWHFNDLEIPSGIVPDKKENDLNIFILIKKGIDEVIIKKDTPLVYLTPLINDKINIEFLNKKEKDHSFKKTFSILKNFVVEKL